MDHAFKPLKKAPVYLKVFEAIQADILSEKLPEGTALPTEGELCEQFGVTRSSVREGIRLLEQAHLVRRGRQKKLIVIRPKSDDVANATSTRLANGGVTFHEVWQTLAVMYPSAAGLAADLLGPGERNALEGRHRQMKEVCETDYEGIVKGAVGFFQALAYGLNNRVLLALLQSLNMLIEESLKQVIAETPDAKARIVKAQKEILRALKNKDPQKASAWMKRHIDDLKRGYDVAGIELDQPISI